MTNGVLSFIKYVSAFRFSIEYCHQTAERAAANTSLGAHRDDSHLTINLCLFSDAEGSELQFDRTQADF